MRPEVSTCRLIPLDVVTFRSLTALNWPRSSVALTTIFSTSSAIFDKLNEKLCVLLLVVNEIAPAPIEGWLKKHISPSLRTFPPVYSCSAVTSMGVPCGRCTSSTNSSDAIGAFPPIARFVMMHAPKWLIVGDISQLKFTLCESCM